MKINFNCWNLGLSGGNRYIFELSNRLVDRGYKVTLTHAGLPKYYDWWLPNPIKAKIIDCGYNLSERLLFKAKLKHPSLNDRIQKLVDNQPDCDVNVATYCFTAYATEKSTVKFKAYLVQHYEPLFFTNDAEANYAKQTYSLPLKKLCVSKWLADKTNGVLIGNGINLGKFQNFNQKRCFNVLGFNRDINWKNSAIISIVVRNFKDSLFLDKPVSDHDLVSSYNLSKVLIYASEKEGFGYQQLEAMACGCAVVSSPCSEYLVDGVNCLIVDSLNPDDYVKAAQKIVNDDSLRHKLVFNGLKTAKKFDFDNVVDNFLEVIY